MSVGVEGNDRNSQQSRGDDGALAAPFFRAEAVEDADESDGLRREVGLRG